jgi:mannose-1-phosphate guanylyltransferase
LLSEGAKVIGYVDDGYWLDLGTPLAFVQGSKDLVRGIAPSPAVPGQTGEALFLDSAEVAHDAAVTGGSVIGRGARVAAGAKVTGAVVFDDAEIGEDAVVTDSVIGRGAVVGARTSLHGVVVGDGAVIGADNELLDGVRVFPRTLLADDSIRFSSDQS